MGKGVEELYRRARRKAACRGFAHLQEDFASWYILRHLEGVGTKQTLNQALVDFIRIEMGDARRRQKRQLELEHQQMLRESDVDLSPEDRAIIFDAIKKLVTPHEEKIFYLYFREGYFCKEIGAMFGVSEAYISLRITEIIRRFRREKFLRSGVRYYG